MKEDYTKVPPETRWQHEDIERLYQQVLRGERTEDELFREVYHYLRRRLPSWLRGLYLALQKYYPPQDIHQECWIGVWEYWRRHNPQLSFRAFIKMRVHARAVNLLERATALKRDVDLVPFDETVEHMLHDKAHEPEINDTPLDHMLRAERGAELAKIIDGPYVSRELLESHFVHKSSIREIAKQTGKSKSALAERIKRQVKCIQEQMAA